MTSSLGAGDAAKQAEKARQSACRKSTKLYKKHEWVKKGSWPSTWYECKNCQATIYNK